MGYCVVDKEKQCSETREKVLRDNHGKLPKKYEHTSMQSCLYCASFME